MDAADVRPLGRAMGSKMVVTVLMAVYDTPVAMLRQAVDSILNQTFADFEFLIVDDGSRDQLVRSCLVERAKADPRIRIAWEPHRGLTASLNRGLALATGRLVARQDADDWSGPSRLEQQLAWFRVHPETAVLGTDAWTHQQDGSPLWRLHLPATNAGILAAFPKGNPFVHGSVMFPRAEAVAAGGYREEFRCSQDYDFFWRLAERGSARNLSEALYHYRYTSASVSAERAGEQARAHRAIRRLGECRRRGEMEDVARALAEAGEASDAAWRVQLKQADHRMLAGDYPGAWQAYRSLLESHPANPLGWAKLARLGLFRVFPKLREACFR
jgi:glycosyltransferase involved in cell wall biosynthesis